MKLSTLNNKPIIQKLKRDGYCIIKSNLESECIKAKKELNRILIKTNVQKKIDLNDGQFSRVQIKNLTGTSGSYQKYKEDFKAIYIPQKKKNIIRSLQTLFKKILIFQNKFFNLDENFGLRNKDDFFPASRIHFYSDNSFMGDHRDTHYIKEISGHPLPLVKIAFPLSQYGKDFQKGGFYLRKGKLKIYPENKMLLGDILLFDGRLKHGVTKIIGKQNPWRAQLFVNHYAKLSKAKKISLNGIKFSDLWVKFNHK